MDPNDIHTDKTGYVEWGDNGQFCYFNPNMLPFVVDDIGHRNRTYRIVSSISKLDGRISNMPEKEKFVLLNSFAIKEATMSSAIEGSRSTVSDIFKEDREKETDPIKALDNQEVKNYKEALIHGVKNLSEGNEVTSELILSMHRILMKGTRGENKQPGRYRETNVWVGSPKDTIETAEFVPPPPSKIQYLMNNLLEYMNSDFDNPILRISLSHYQFETIHPFTDGNGRMGRLIIMLMLYREGLMENPFLYLSEYFNRFREKYIKGLMSVRVEGNFNQWFEFFLEALESQTASSIRLTDSLDSYRKTLEEISSGWKNDDLKVVCNMLMENPFITTSDVVNVTGLTAPTARKIISHLVVEGVLEEVPGKRKATLYKAGAILEMLERM